MNPGNNPKQSLKINLVCGPLTYPATQTSVFETPNQFKDQYSRYLSSVEAAYSSSQCFYSKGSFSIGRPMKSKQNQPQI